MRVRLLGLLLAAPSILGAQSLADTTGGADARAIRLIRAESNAAIARHDADAFAASMAPDIMVVTSRSAKTTTREAYASFLRNPRPGEIFRRVPDEVKVFAPWNMASERGTWTGSWTESDGEVRIGGSYFAKWRKVSGVWLIESETFVPETCTGSAYCRAVP